MHWEGNNEYDCGTSHKRNMAQMASEMNLFLQPNPYNTLKFYREKSIITIYCTVISWMIHGFQAG